MLARQQRELVSWLVGMASIEPQAGDCRSKRDTNNRPLQFPVSFVGEADPLRQQTKEIVLRINQPGELRPRSPS